MTASNSTIDDLRARHARNLLTAKLWFAVLEQRDRWVPRGAWAAYATSAIRSRTFTDDDGEEVTLRFFEPDVSVEGSVALADMELSWRQSVTSFLWRRSRTICHGLSFGFLYDSGLYRDAPDDVLDEVIEREVSYAAMVNDETLRRAWFDERPLVVALRTGIIAEREARIARPVLLGAVPEQPAAAALLLP